MIHILEWLIALVVCGLIATGGWFIASLVIPRHRPLGGEDDLPLSLPEIELPLIISTDETPV